MDYVTCKPHVCQLPQREDIIVKYINTGKFVFLRRKLKKIMLVSDTLHLARSVFRSDSSIRYEQERHLRKHYYTIHPFSYWNLYWSIFQTIVHIFCFCFLPLEISQTSNKYLLIVSLIDLTFMADNVMNFLLGHFERNINHVILNLRVIAKKYLRSTFIIDFISSLNIYLISIFHNSVRLDDATYFWFCKLVLFLKLLRLRNLLNHMSLVTDNLRISSIISSTFKLILFTLFFFMWYAGLVIIFVKTNSSKFPAGHMYSHIFVTIQIIHVFFLFGRERVYTVHDVSVKILITEIALTMTGIIFYVYLLAHIMHIVEKYRGSFHKHSNILNQLREYCKYKNLSLKLTNKILDYYKFKYNQEYFREDYIMNTISQQLKETIIEHVCYELVKGVAVFTDVPTKILTKIFSAMEVVHYLENDIIVSAGDIGYCMYIILYGTVAVYTDNGQELCHLKDGGHFGEIAIVSNQKRVATVIAIEPCEMYKLTKWAFEAIIMPYPELYKRIQNVALKRLQHLHKLQ